MTSSNWTRPVLGQKDGSLVVEIETTVDGNDNYATATRMVALAFDSSGKATIRKTTQHLKRHIGSE